MDLAPTSADIANGVLINEAKSFVIFAFSDNLKISFIHKEVQRIEVKSIKIAENLKKISYYYNQIRSTVANVFAHKKNYFASGAYAQRSSLPKCYYFMIPI